MKCFGSYVQLEEFLHAGETRCDCFKLETAHGLVRGWMTSRAWYITVFQCGGDNSIKMRYGKRFIGIANLPKHRAPAHTLRATALNKFMSYTQSPINYVFTSLRPVTYVWVERPRGVHCFDEKLPNVDVISGPLLRPIVARFKTNNGGCSAKTSAVTPVSTWHLFSFSVVIFARRCWRRSEHPPESRDRSNNGPILIAHFAN